MRSICTRARDRSSRRKRMSLQLSPAPKASVIRQRGGQSTFVSMRLQVVHRNRGSRTVTSPNVASRCSCPRQSFRWHSSLEPGLHDRCSPWLSACPGNDRSLSPRPEAASLRCKVNPRFANIAARPSGWQISIRSVAQATGVIPRRNQPHLHIASSVPPVGYRPDRSMRLRCRHPPILLCGQPQVWQRLC